MKIEITHNTETIKNEFKRLAANSEDLKPALKEIGSSGLASIKIRFLGLGEGKEFDGIKWKGLSPSTQKNKIPGTKTERGSGHILRQDSLLYKSLHWEIEDEGVLLRTGSFPYVRVQQKGGKVGRNNKVTLPARPYLFLTGEDEEEFITIIGVHILG